MLRLFYTDIFYVQVQFGSHEYFPHRNDCIILTVFRRKILYIVVLAF